MKYKSPLLSSATGSVGGLNASHNKGGSYFRAKPNPKDRGTPRRNNARSVLGSVSSAWNTLTDAERDSWHLYATNVKLAKEPNSIHTMSGFHHFVRSNTARAAVVDEFVLIRSGPNDFSLPPTILPISAEIFRKPTPPDDGRIYLVTILDFATVPPLWLHGNWVLGYASKPFNAGKSNYFAGLTFVGKELFPEEADDPSTFYWKTPYHRLDDTPFNMVGDLVVSFIDGRTGHPVRFHASFPE